MNDNLMITYKTNHAELDTYGLAWYIVRENIKERLRRPSELSPFFDEIENLNKEFFDDERKRGQAIVPKKVAEIVEIELNKKE